MKQYYLLCSALLFVFACKHETVKEKRDKNLPFEAIGVVLKANPAPPVVTLLDTCPKPKVTVVADAKDSKNAPVVKKADFYAPMTTYTAEQGLYSSIGCIFKDREGNLWFGTNGVGVSFYNGKSFQSYGVGQGLNSSVVSCIAEDSKGNFWLGSRSGLCCYDGKYFRTFVATDGLSDNSIQDIKKDGKGNLWFATGHGVSRYDGKSFVNYTTADGLANNYVACIYIDGKGKLWFGTGRGGISYYDGSSLITYGTGKEFADNTINSIAEDDKGNIWFGSDGSGVCKFNGKTFKHYTTADGLASNDISSICNDKKGNLWIGTRGEGLSKYDGKSFVSISTPQGLANNVVNCMALDGNGNLWIGTDAGGASRYDGDVLTTYSSSQGLGSDIVFSICKDKSGNYWFGTLHGGVSCYDGKTFTTYTTEQGLPNNNLAGALQDDKGNMWFATQGGISCYNGKTFTSYGKDQGLGFRIEQIYEDKNGDMWLGSFGHGVIKFDGKTLSRYNVEQGLAGNKIYDIIEDDNGNLWFCTGGQGICKYDGVNFTTYTAAQGLCSNQVYCAMKDRNGNLWFGSDGGGVSRYDGKSFVNYTTANGLSDNTVFGICYDTNGNIWLGTNEGFTGLVGYKQDTSKTAEMRTVTGDNGLSNINIREKFLPVFERFNLKDGYPIRDVNTHAMHVDNGEIVWAGTGDRLVRFNYSAIRKNTDSLKIFIQDIKLQNEDVPWYRLQNEKLIGKNKKIGGEDSMASLNEEILLYGNPLTRAQSDSMYQKFGQVSFSGITPFYPLPENLILPFDNNNISFEYGAIEPAKSSLVKYQYKLDGYDNKWSPLTDKTMAVFGNVREGNYTFRLRALSPYGVWSKPVTYSFTVLAPWYRTWWAYCGYILFAAAILFSLYEWRTTKLRKDKIHLEQLVKERTLEIVKQKEEVEKKNALIEAQKTLVEEKNKDIMDSITYAKRLQEAILPPTQLIKTNFPDSFVLYRPKDIVAGDFYWMEKSGDTILLAACDCTGHGVPGAMVSVVCSNALNRALKEFKIKETGKLLDQTRKLVIETFEKSESNVNDGMDISFCAINLKEATLEWSGANNPLWIITSTSEDKKPELKELQPDKQSIGKQDGQKPFKTHSVKLNKGDTLYLFTDGYPDQFGGPKGKKFKYQQLVQILTETVSLPLEWQRNVLDKMFTDWKGALEQVDDVLIIGVRI
jgi:ligand-binding sensor domain-containing protein/serine phosphatase RsbU (regulator of sigma subunit)